MNRDSASGEGAAPAASNPPRVLPTGTLPCLGCPQQPPCVGCPRAIHRPGSCAQAAVEALVRFSEEERLFGAAKAHELFDGVLAEHALALAEVLDMLREDDPAKWVEAVDRLDQEIAYIRALGSVAATEEEEDAK